MKERVDKGKQAILTKNELQLSMQRLYEHIEKTIHSIVHKNAKIYK